MGAERIGSFGQVRRSQVKDMTFESLRNRNDTLR
jgi:hypothetical protein